MHLNAPWCALGTYIPHVIFSCIHTIFLLSFSISTSRALPASSTPSYSKPKPHERKLLRSQTVAGGLGNNRLSKKAMLLKWCQFITEDYDVSNAVVQYLAISVAIRIHPHVLWDTIFPTYVLHSVFIRLQNVNIHNFAESFSNGMAFCAMMHHFLPDQIPFNTLKSCNRVRLSSFL